MTTSILPPASDAVIAYAVAVGVFAGWIFGSLFEWLRGKERRKADACEALQLAFHSASEIADACPLPSVANTHQARLSCNVMRRRLALQLRKGDPTAGVAVGRRESMTNETVQ